jgi:hypothetical protein
MLGEPDYNYYLLNKNLEDLKSIFLPHYSFIKYAVETPPLAKTNKTYATEKIKATIKYYHDNLLPYSFILTTFTLWTSYELNIKETTNNSNILSEKIYEKLL